MCYVESLRSWLYASWFEILHGFQLTTGFIWAQVREFDRFGDYFWTCALINWSILWQYSLQSNCEMWKMGILCCLSWKIWISSFFNIQWYIQSKNQLKGNYSVNQYFVSLACYQMQLTYYHQLEESFAIMMIIEYNRMPNS